MRTINKNMLDRLAAEASEAELQGLTKIAMALTDQIECNAIRADSASYRYNANDFHEDINRQLWNIVVRAADFYNTGFDAAQMQKILDKTAEDFVHNFCVVTNINHGVGAYEDSVAGEAVEKAEIEVG